MKLSRRGVLGASAAAGVLLCATAWAQPSLQAGMESGMQAGVPPEVAAALPRARLQGSGMLRVMLFRVYDARLWRGEQAVGANYAAAPLALDVVYARKIESKDLVDKTLELMRRQSAIDESTALRWRQRLQALLPNVVPGDRITAVNDPGLGLQMFLNGKPHGDVEDARFARFFLGIWLAPQSSQPELRRALLGSAAPTE